MIDDGLHLFHSVSSLLPHQAGRRMAIFVNEEKMFVDNVNGVKDTRRLYNVQALCCLELQKKCM